MTLRRPLPRLALAAVLAALAGAPLAAADAQAGRDVRIRRDTWGVPHVLGRTDADAAYGLGFAQSEDDFATLQESVLASRGRLASLKGPEAVPSDILFQLLDVQKVVDAGYDRDLPAATRRVVEAYAEGANRYARLHPEKVAPGVLPITGRDLAAFTVFRGPSFYGLDGVFADIAAGKAPYAKAPAATGMEARGSNAVAVAPSRSADGHTRLLFNSHQPWTGPLSWYEVVVESGEGWHIAGAVFPGAPFLLGGHNAHLGWAATVNHPDLADVYRLVVNPANPDQYRLDGRWRDFDKRTVAIAVKGADGRPTTVTREILHSEHGPALRTANGVFAVRYPTFGGVRQLAEYQAMNKARNVTEWRAALAMQALPSINYVYGDERGHIGYVSNGIYPLRKEGPDWSGVLPGDRSDLIWRGVRPYAQTPQIWDPRSGFLFNANNTPFRATDGSDDLKPAAYPASMGIQPLGDMTNRGWRAIETFGADKSITAAAFERYKFDIAYSEHSDERAWVKEILAADSSRDADLAAAQAVLRAWDGRMDLDSRGGALVAVMWLQKRQHPDWTPLQMLRGSAPLLKLAAGRIDPRWGDMNRLRRGATDLPLDGGPDTFRAVYGRPDPDGKLHGVNGDCYIMFMDWDAKGRLVSRSIHQFGSATLDATSPHYADQSPLFAAHKTKPVWFTEADLKGHVERDYRPD